MQPSVMCGNSCPFVCGAAYNFIQDHSSLLMARLYGVGDAFRIVIKILVSAYFCVQKACLYPVAFITILANFIVVTKLN